MNPKTNTPIVYLWVYKKMVEKFGKDNQIILAKELLEVLRRTVYQIPRQYDYYIMKEMCGYGLLERANTQKYKLLGAQADKRLKNLNSYFLW